MQIVLGHATDTHSQPFPPRTSSRNRPVAQCTVRRSEGDAAMRGDNRHAFATRAVHGGGEPDPTTGAVTTPIYATSTYAQESPGAHKGYAYARTRNPTREALERCLADLENGSVGFAFASGSASIATVLECLDQGAHVIATDDLYGGTFRLFDRVRKRSAGLEVSLVDMSDPQRVEAAIRRQTRLI
jgi:cystathionine gamma-lyase